jgi:hypothetical protein
MSTVRPAATLRMSAVVRDVLGPHTGHRFVEQQHLGLEGQRRCDLQRALDRAGSSSALRQRSERQK